MRCAVNARGFDNWVGEGVCVCARARVYACGLLGGLDCRLNESDDLIGRHSAHWGGPKLEQQVKL